MLGCWDPHFVLLTLAFSSHWASFLLLLLPQASSPPLFPLSFSTSRTRPRTSPAQLPLAPTSFVLLFALSVFSLSLSLFPCSHSFFSSLFRSFFPSSPPSSSPCHHHPLPRSRSAVDTSRPFASAYFLSFTSSCWFSSWAYLSLHSRPLFSLHPHVLSRTIPLSRLFPLSRGKCILFGCLPLSPTARIASAAARSLRHSLCHFSFSLSFSRLGPPRRSDPALWPDLPPASTLRTLSIPSLRLPIPSRSQTSSDFFPRNSFYRPSSFVVWFFVLLDIAEEFLGREKRASRFPSLPTLQLLPAAPFTAFWP